MVLLEQRSQQSGISAGQHQAGRARNYRYRDYPSCHDSDDIDSCDGSTDVIDVLDSCDDSDGSDDIYLTARTPRTALI